MLIDRVCLPLYYRIKTNHEVYSCWKNQSKMGPDFTGVTFTGVTKRLVTPVKKRYTSEHLYCKKDLYVYRIVSRQNKWGYNLDLG